jgi:hypothetical protein
MQLARSSGRSSFPPPDALLPQAYRDSRMSLSPSAMRQYPSNNDGASPKWTQKEKLRKKLENDPNLSKRQAKKLKLLKKKSNKRAQNADTLTKRQLHEWNSVIRAFVVDRKLTRFVIEIEKNKIKNADSSTDKTL